MESVENGWKTKERNEGMTEIISSCSDPQLLGAIEKQWVKFSKIYESTGHVEIHETPQCYLYSTGIPASFVNGIGLANLTKDDIEAQLKDAKAHFKKRNLPWTWWIGPTSPPDLSEHLERLGLTRSSDMAGMAVDLTSLKDQALTIPDLKVTVVDDLRLLRDWMKVVAVCFSGFPMSTYKDRFYDMESEIGFGEDLPRRNYIGYFKGQPVATSTFVLRDGVVGLFTIGTVPNARRRGIGTEMTLVPMREAHRMGYKVAVLHSAAIGYSMYEKIGFRKYCEISGYNIQE